MTQQYPQGSSIAPRGIYLYDIEVVGASPYDTDTRCSKALKITQTKFEIEEIEVGYVLEDTAGKSAYQGKVTVFNKNLQNLAEIEDGTITNLPGTSNPIWNEVTLNIEFPDEGPYTFLVSAIDDHRELDKAHRRKTALQKNQRRVLPIHTILLDAGHGGSEGPGTLGSYYWDPESRHNVNRHNREEAELNEDVRQALEAILQWHNNPKNRPSYILRYEEVPRSAWKARVRWAYDRTRNTDRNPVKLLISIHHNSFWTYDKDSKWYYPYSRSDNHGMYHTNNYRREHGSDCNFYRFEKFDLDLVDSITNTLRQCMRESDYQLTLPVDERLIGHRFRDPKNPIPGDPEEQTDRIRRTQTTYGLSFQDPRTATYTENGKTRIRSGGAIVVRPCASSTLLELVTLTNYDDEDYRMLEGADHLLASAIYWGIRGFISMHPTVLRWENMRYQE
jgi:N-acetylmuramoyl-L-alanine amidase